MQIVERIELQVIVETLLIVSVTALDLTVVPRGARTENVMMDTVFGAEYVEVVNALCFCGMSELTAAVRLNLLRSIAEVDDRSFHKIHGGITALFLICVYEPFARSFFYDRVLIELLRLFP